jgi:hypothetical protein
MDKNTDKDTDKMTHQSRKGKHESVEVVETVGCGGLQSPMTFNINFSVDLV